VYQPFKVLALAKKRGFLTGERLELSGEVILIALPK